MRTMIWLLVALVAILFTGCDKELEPEKRAEVRLSYSELQNVPPEGAAIRVQDVGEMRGDTLYLTACEVALLADADKTIDVKKIETYLKVRESAKGNQVMDICTGNGTCSIICGGVKYVIVGIPSDCTCRSWFGALFILCNTCPNKQVVCIVSTDK